MKAISANNHDQAALDAELRELAVSFQQVIPGFADAALIVVRDGIALAVSAPHDGVQGPYRSSLLVGSLHEPTSAQLLVRASSAHAFRALAEDLVALSGLALVRAPLVDLHLEGVSLKEDAEAETAEQSALNQAVGALIDRGWLPEEAAEELARIGVRLAVPSAVVAQLFLRGLVNRDRA